MWPKIQTHLRQLALIRQAMPGMNMSVGLMMFRRSDVDGVHPSSWMTDPGRCGSIINTDNGSGSSGWTTKI